jgi:hypothetical protein
MSTVIKYLDSKEIIYRYYYNQIFCEINIYDELTSPDKRKYANITIYNDRFSGHAYSIVNRENINLSRFNIIILEAFIMTRQYKIVTWHSHKDVTYVEYNDEHYIQIARLRFNSYGGLNGFIEEIQLVAVPTHITNLWPPYYKSVDNDYNTQIIKSVLELKKEFDDLPSLILAELTKSTPINITGVNKIIGEYIYFLSKEMILRDSSKIVEKFKHI